MREVESDRTCHGRSSLCDVDAANRQPTTDHLYQKGMHDEPGVGVEATVLFLHGKRSEIAFVRRRGPRDQETRRLQLAEDLWSAAVVRKTRREPRGERAFATQTKQHVSLGGGEAREDLAGHLVRDRRGALSQSPDLGRLLRRAADGMGPEDEYGGPPLRPSDQCSDH